MWVREVIPSRYHVTWRANTSDLTQLKRSQSQPSRRIERYDWSNSPEGPSIFFSPCSSSSRSNDCRRKQQQQQQQRQQQQQQPEQHQAYPTTSQFLCHPYLSIVIEYVLTQRHNRDSSRPYSPNCAPMIVSRYCHQDLALSNLSPIFCTRGMHLART